jgi:hypothetical protein
MNVTDQSATFTYVMGAETGGARRDRTDDLMLAKHALSQLSYGPNPYGSSQTKLPDHTP